MNRILGGLVVGLLSSGCAMTFDLVGGPKNQRTSLSARDALDALQPKVSASKGALDALQTVRTRARVGNVLLYSGMGFLVPCIGAPMLSRGFSDVTAAVTVSSCATTLALEVIAIVVLPKMGAYGDILRAFNADFPATPFSSVAMGVEAPPPMLLTGR